MKIQSSVTRQIYNYDPPAKSGMKTICPECSHLRIKPGHKTEPVLTWDTKLSRGFCHNCEAAFFEYRPYEAKQYALPEWKNITEIDDDIVKYFESRMIGQEVLKQMKIYSDKEYMPQLKDDVPVICFPYFYNGNLVNIKYRGPEKTFKMVAGAELILWNLDCVATTSYVVITEGEMDALAMIQAGFLSTLSVPNGANKNLEYLDNYIDLFKDVQKIYIAVDQDTRGIELKGELIRRFGAERCYVVSFRDCKDANEYLIKYGPEIKNVLDEAKPVPVEGIVEIPTLYADIRNLYEEGVKSGLTIGQKDLDDLVTWETGRLAIITGIPASGKSEFVDYIVCKLNMKYGWKAGFFTPENYPLKFHYMKLFEKLIGKKFGQKDTSELEWDMAYDYIKDNFFYLLNEEDFTINSILSWGRILVKTKGIKVLVVDPYNKLDHQFKGSETQYISKFLDLLIRFAKMNDTLVILVAHPTKMGKSENGKMIVPTLYDISGSAHFYNKADYGITIHREEERQTNDQGESIGFKMINEVAVLIQKVKFKHLGTQGLISMSYDLVTGRFNVKNKESVDRTNWLMPDATPNQLSLLNPPKEQKEIEDTPEEDIGKELEFREGEPPY